MAQDVIQLRVPGPQESSAARTIPYEPEFAAGTKARTGAFEFVRSEFGPGTVVKGAPYSAEATTETMQTLADGNRIVHKDVATVARDKEGRTRRDVSLPLLSGMSTEDAPRFSFVQDPAANTSYTLDHKSKTAAKSSSKPVTVKMFTGNPDDAPPSAGVRIERKVITAGIIRDGDSGAKSESLGKQTIEGVVAEGTRSIQTIPAGEIGNDRPIEIVSERWYSPELQTVVLSKHTDPRQGETTFRLTNLRREEPAKSLFEVPADYTLTAGQEPVRLIQDLQPKQ